MSQNNENDWECVSEMIKPKRSVKELKDYLNKLKAVIDYHVLTAANFIKESHVVEKMIEEREKEE